MKKLLFTGSPHSIHLLQDETSEGDYILSIPHTHHELGLVNPWVTEEDLETFRLIIHSNLRYALSQLLPCTTVELERLAKPIIQKYINELVARGYVWIP